MAWIAIGQADLFTISRFPLYVSGMRISLRNKKHLILIIVLVFALLAGGGAGFFFLRPPLLIVTDSSFSMLYGSERLAQKQRQAAMSFFRRVIPVLVSENAGPDLVAIAVNETFSLPWAVLFPYRYLEGARIYKENNHDMRVFVMGGSNPYPATLTGTGITYVRTDTMLDLYRAGLSAVLLAGEKNILVFDDGLYTDEDQELLRELLVSRGFLGELIFVSLIARSPPYSETGCIIVTGPVTRFLEQNLNIPVVLFSWVDPAITPRMVKLVFDDSPWALVTKALRFRDSEEIRIPSQPIALSGRIDVKSDFRRLRSLIKEIF